MKWPLRERTAVKNLQSIAMPNNSTGRRVVKPDKIVSRGQKTRKQIIGQQVRLTKMRTATVIYKRTTYHCLEDISSGNYTSTAGIMFDLSNM